MGVELKGASVDQDSSTETVPSDIDEDCWQEVFVRQLSSGRRWKDILQDEFNKRMFLDHSDAIYLCQKAQAEAYEKVLDMLGENPRKNNAQTVNKIQSLIDDLWEKDISGLGLPR